MSSFRLITCPLLAQVFIKKPFLHEYELVLLTTCPLLTLFPAKVALLPDVSYFLLMTCPGARSEFFFLGGGGVTDMEKLEILAGWVTKVCLKCTKKLG